MRRGAEKSEIYSICFDSNSKFFACSSNRGTIHIFSSNIALKNLIEKSKQENYKEPEKSNENEDTSENSKFTGLIPKFLIPNYFKGQCSFAKFRIHDLKSICAFGPGNTIIGRKLFLI